MTFEQWITLSATFGTAAGAVWAVLHKIVIPAIVKDRADRREHTQRQEQLEQAYRLSELAVKDQLVVETLADLIAFIKDTNISRLDKIEQQLGSIPKISKDIEKIKFDYREFDNKMRIIMSLVLEHHEEIRRRNATDD